VLAEQVLYCLNPHLQSILLWLFWRWGFINYLLGWPQTVILLIAASHVARITDVSHQYLAPFSHFFENDRNLHDRLTALQYKHKSTYIQN
jgi:hypothetical protein